MPPLQPYRDFLKCLMYGLKRSNDATTVRTSLKKWIRFLSVYIAIIPAHLHCQMQPNPPGVEFLGTISKYSKRKFRRCLFTSSVKREIRHFHVVVVQKPGREMYKKHGARAKLLFCWSNLLSFWRSRYRPRRWILKSLLTHELTKWNGYETQAYSGT